MSKSDKIANAKNKALNKIQKCNANVSLIKYVAVVPVLEEGDPAPPAYDPDVDEKPAMAASTIVDLGYACKVKNVSVQRIESSNGKYETGDRSFVFSAKNVTKANIDDTEFVLYGSDEYRPITINDSGIFSATVQWEIIARKKVA